MWNTGCNVVANTLGVGVNLLDGEDKSLALSVPARDLANWESVIFPWCVSTSEVHNKAFRVANMQSGKVFMYLFQDYHTDLACWSLDMNDPWGARVNVRNGLQSDDPQERLPALDIYIMSDRVCGFAAVPDNGVAAKVLATALTIAGAIGSIVGAAFG